MKNFGLLILQIAALNLKVLSQNLVLNPSFELYSLCPSAGQFSVLSNVANPSFGSPDYFNSCSTNTNYTTPLSIYGHQTPRTGNAYIGLYTFLDVPGDICEYIQCQLSTPMTQGEYYCVRFYVNAADSSLFLSPDIGVYLSNTAVFNNTSSVFTVSPTYNNTYTFDKNEWKEVSFNFLSNGGEKFLTIGNYKLATQTQTTLTQGASWVSGTYVFIDDVSVMPGSCVITNLTERNETSYINIPNPVEDGIVLLFFSPNGWDIQDIKVYDSMGKEVFPSKQSERNKMEIDLNNYPNGIYYIASSNMHFKPRKVLTIKN